MKERGKEVNWENLKDNLEEAQLDGWLDGEESHDHVISSEEEFQELLRGLTE